MLTQLELCKLMIICGLLFIALGASMVLKNTRGNYKEPEGIAYIIVVLGLIGIIAGVGLICYEKHNKSNEIENILHSSGTLYFNGVEVPADILSPAEIVSDYNYKIVGDTVYVFSD